MGPIYLNRHCRLYETHMEVSGRHFDNDDDIINAVDQSVKVQNTDLYKKGGWCWNVNVLRPFFKIKIIFCSLHNVSACMMYKFYILMTIRKFIILNNKVRVLFLLNVTLGMWEIKKKIEKHQLYAAIECLCWSKCFYKYSNITKDLYLLCKIE